MQENLRVTHFRNGRDIYKLTSDNTNRFNLIPGYFNYDTDAENAAYGKLYNWFVINSRVGIIAPEGWHIPSKDEWLQLITTLRNNPGVGGQLKEAGQAHWIAPNLLASNKSGFTALPGGDASFYVQVSGMGWYGIWWTSTTPNPAAGAYAYKLTYNKSDVELLLSSQLLGFSIRCIKD